MPILQVRTLRLEKEKKISHAPCAGCRALLCQVRAEEVVQSGHHLGGGSLSMLCPSDTREGENRMVSSGKEQMPYSWCMLSPSLMSLGVSLMSLQFGKPSSSITLSLPLRHLAPVDMETVGSENGWGRVSHFSFTERETKVREDLWKAPAHS